MPDVDTNEKQSNLGYLSLKVEATKGTPVTPDTEVPLYSEDIQVNLNIDEEKSMRGVREARSDFFRGQEDYQGTLKVLAEPQTAMHFFNMMMAVSSSGNATTGYTHAFTLGTPKSYTIEILKGNIPFRLYGVEAKSITPAFEENKMVLEVAIAALGQFSTAKISSASGTTVVLDDSERSNPNKGLTTSDTLRLYDVSLGTYEDVTISAVDSDGKTITVSTISGTYVAGDQCYLAPMTPSYSLDAPFNWGKTEYRFADTAANALSASQTQVEKGSGWSAMHNLEDEAGSKRSGGQGPAALIRTDGDIEATIKKFFNDGQELNRYLEKDTRALVVRHYSPTDAGSNGTKAEIRVTINEYGIKDSSIPLSVGEIIYHSMSLIPKYKTADSQMFDIKVVNSDDGSSL